MDTEEGIHMPIIKWGGAGRGREWRLIWDKMYHNDIIVNEKDIRDIHIRIKKTMSSVLMYNHKVSIAITQ